MGLTQATARGGKH